MFPDRDCSGSEREPTDVEGQRTTGVLWIDPIGRTGESRSPQIPSFCSADMLDVGVSRRLTSRSRRGCGQNEPHARPVVTRNPIATASHVRTVGGDAENHPRVLSTDKGFKLASVNHCKSLCIPLGCNVGGNYETNSRSVPIYDDPRPNVRLCTPSKTLPLNLISTSEGSGVRLCSLSGISQRIT